MSKQIVITDPYPRTLDLIFTKKKLKELSNEELKNFYKYFAIASA